MLFQIAARTHVHATAAWLTIGRWATFWLVAGLLPWLNLKFLVTTIALIAAAIGVLWTRGRPRHMRAALATSALVLAGPLTLGAFHLWAFGALLGPRGAAELTTSPGRAAMMLLGLHLDQGQGMFWQQPLLLAGVAALVPFARRHPRLALIVPDAFESSHDTAGERRQGALDGPRRGSGSCRSDTCSSRPRKCPASAGPVKPIVLTCLVYQALLAIRWLPDPHVLFPVFEENLAARNSLFPIAMRPWLPSFYFWDFSSYWTYGPNLAAYAGLGLLLLSGALSLQSSRSK